MKLVPIVLVAVAAAVWTRVIVAQPPLPREGAEFALLETSAPPPGIGKDWRRFGSGLEDDRPVATRVRFVSSTEDCRPVVWIDRFGSGLEDDAPVRPISIFLMSGLEGLTPVRAVEPPTSTVRFGSGLDEDRPMATGVRFGSGLEDDAPAHATSVLNQPGF